MTHNTTKSVIGQHKPISKEGYTQLQERLQTAQKDYAMLRTTIAETRELKDADDYDTVEDDMRLAFLQKEIDRLQYELRTYRIFQEAPTTTAIQIGSKVRLKNGSQEMLCMLVSSIEADPSKGKISDESPLGRALLGKVLNALVKVTAPRKSFLYRVVGIEQPR